MPYDTIVWVYQQQPKGQIDNNKKKKQRRRTVGKDQENVSLNSMNFLLDKIWFISAKCHVVRYCCGSYFYWLNSSSNQIKLGKERDFVVTYFPS